MQHFIYKWTIQDGQNIFDQTEITNHIIVVRMLQNWSDHTYLSHYSIIKYVGFELIYYTINLNIVSSFMFFSDLVSVLLV